MQKPTEYRLYLICRGDLFSYQDCGKYVAIIILPGGNMLHW